MRLLFEQENLIKKLKELISLHTVGDYIYMYPPRQAYQSIDKIQAVKLSKKSIDKFPSINLYYHVPFCKQLCSFCNLYTKVSKNENERSDYVKLLIEETKMHQQSLLNKKVNTIYLGGGTPSLLEPKDINSLFSYLKNEGIADVFSIPEVAMEVAPDTVEYEKFVELKSVGINRVNLGFQASNISELQSIGRKHGVSTLSTSFEIIKKIGFKNVCIDLIYGLQSQTIESWHKSLEFVINYNPETICIYPLTLRPNTAYSQKGYNFIDSDIQSRKYDLAVNALTNAGYKQENHVRFVKKNGGYLQKEYHWKMENLLGLGAGARSYFWFCDTRNNYGTITRDKAYKYYVESIKNLQIPITDGYIMTDEERMRKAIILNLISLDRQWFRDMFTVDIIEVFPLLTELEAMELLSINEATIELTETGIKYRDLIVQLFFSSKVIGNIKNYKYDD
jgi:oxygen-independent coproporphyrinogen III oxidase